MSAVDDADPNVALASRVLIDAMKGIADIYVVCTNDSDLVVMPMRLVKEELNRQVGLLSPMEPKRASNELKQTGPVWHRQITPADLAACQVPDELDDAQGTIPSTREVGRKSREPRRSGAL